MEMIVKLILHSICVLNYAKVYTKHNIFHKKSQYMIFHVLSLIMIICYILLVLSFFIVEGIPEKKSCFLQCTASPPCKTARDISRSGGRGTTSWQISEKPERSCARHGRALHCRPPQGRY